VMLIAVHGGGHVVPGPDAAFPRILGKVTPVIDGPRQVWDFFARQPPMAAGGGAN
jgi:polyhydroxybutyrate depolymerase